MVPTIQKDIEKESNLSKMPRELHTDPRSWLGYDGFTR